MYCSNSSAFAMELPQPSVYQQTHSVILKSERSYSYTLTLKQLSNIFQDILFSNIVPYNCNISVWIWSNTMNINSALWVLMVLKAPGGRLNKKDVDKMVFILRRGPGHQYPQCWVHTHVFPVVYGLNFTKNITSPYTRVGNSVPAWNVSLWLLWRVRCD